jgi:hypothetical protein
MRVPQGPKIIVGGGISCDSLSVVRWLRQHNDIDIQLTNRSGYKIGDFFSCNKKPFNMESVQEYICSWKKEFSRKRVDHTPGYLSSEAAPVNISCLAPEAKIVFVMRDPIVRLEKHLTTATTKQEPWSIELLRKFNQPHVILKTLVSKPIPGIVAYESEKALWEGIYNVHLERYKNYIPRDKMHCIIYERLREQPEQELKKLCNFLEIKYTDKSNILFETKRTPIWTQIPRNTKAFLKDYYKKSVYSLRKIVGEDIPEWGY